MRPGPEGRSRPGRSARSEWRSRRRRSARSRRARRTTGTARRTRATQPDLAYHTQQLHQWRLHRLLPRRRSAGERLLRAVANSTDSPRRAAGLVRRRGDKRQRAAGCRLRAGAAIARVPEKWKPVFRKGHARFSEKDMRPGKNRERIRYPNRDVPREVHKCFRRVGRRMSIARNAATCHFRYGEFIARLAVCCAIAGTLNPAYERTADEDFP